MTFWLIIFALSAAVAGTMALTMLRRHRLDRARADYDIAVYSEQLAAVDSEVARGLLSEDAAERSRIEISRRILDADRQRGTHETQQAPAEVTVVSAAGVGVIVVLGSIGLYSVFGAPGYGDLPLKDRLVQTEDRRENRPGQAEAEAEAAAFRPEVRPANPEHMNLVERLRTAVAERPDDPQGLALLARNEAGLGNFAAAYGAQERLIAVLGGQAGADQYADLADMMVLAAGGYVSPEAEAVLGQILARDPQSGVARYYLGLMEAQNGRPDQAFDIWVALLDQSAPQAPWVPAIRAQIEDVAARAGRRYQLPALSAPLPGPSEADIAASQDMAPEDRMAMIENMVAGLSDRLATQGGTATEWARLIGALGVLGNTDTARDIWQEAQQVFADAPEDLEQINEAARASGLTDRPAR